jgi:hypothetical protein
MESKKKIRFYVWAGTGALVGFVFGNFASDSFVDGRQHSALVFGLLIGTLIAASINFFNTKKKR